MPEDGIVIVPNYQPRWYFMPFHDRTQRYACIVAHRRAGKTVACIHDLQRAAATNDSDRPHYAYIAPTYSQAKTTAWDYLIDAAAPFHPYGLKVNQSELKVTYPNGAEIRLFGSDNFNALRGLSLSGCVLDEYADIDPRAYPSVIRPALSDRRGFAIFIGTPRGHNAFYELHRRSLGYDEDGKFQQSLKDEWFSSVLKASELVPINDREPNAKERRLLTSDELDKARKDMTEELYRQEYECDFEAAIVGAYYGRYLADAERDGRIGVVDYDPAHQVYTAWDIGGDRDATAIWFVQLIGRQICVIDYHEGVGADSAPYAKVVTEKPYSYAGHFLPHDAGPNRTGIDKNYRDFLTDHGLRNITILPSGNVQHGINLTRLLLPRCHFDQSNCHLGIEALKMYRAKYDEKNKTLGASPIHDWSSHGADAFRYLAVGLDQYITPSNFNRKIIYPKFGMA
jgi:phage terminase large subunit